MMLPKLGGLPQKSTLALAILFAGLIGALIPGFVAAIGDSYAKLMALPAAILLIFLIAYSRTSLLLLIILMRASTDLVFDESKFEIGGIRIGLGGLVNLFALLIAFLLVLEKPERFPTRALKIWAPFIGLLAWGALISPDRSGAIRLFLQLFSSAAVFVGAFYVVRDVARYRTCLWIVFWSTFPPAFYGYWQVASGGGNDFEGGFRINSTFGHPNIFAFYLTLCIAITLYISKSPIFSLSTARKFMIGLWMLVLLSLLLLTKTRSAWVATAAIFVGYALFFERRYFIYLVLGAIGALFVPGIGDRVLDVTQGGPAAISSYTQMNSFEWRQTIWKSGIGYMSPAHWFTGYGLEAFQYYAPVFFKEGGGGNWGAHGIYVQMLFEIGLIGLGAFFWMWSQVFQALRTLMKTDRLSVFVLAFVSIQYLITAISDNMLDYLSVNWYLWFILGAGAAYAAIPSKPDANAIFAAEHADPV